MRVGLWTILLLLTLSVPAQQLPALFHGSLDRYLITPAAVGDSPFAANLYYRNHFSPVEGAPQTQAFTLQRHIEELQLGVGLSFVHDQVNILGKSRLSLSSRYQVQLLPDHWLTFGMSLHTQHHRIIFDRVQSANPGDEALWSGLHNRVNWEASAGLEYQWSGFTAGFAADQLFQQQLAYEDIAGNQSLAFQLLRHYSTYLSASFNLPADLQFESMLLMRTVQGLPTNLEATVRLVYQDRFWLGGMYRHQAGVGFSCGMDFADRYRISYMADQTLNPSVLQSPLAHEIGLGFKLFGGNGSSIKTAERSLTVLMPENPKLNELRLQYEQLRADLQAIRQELPTEQEQVTEGLPYYVVAGSFKTGRNARLYQKLFYRETGIQTRILKEPRKGYYLVYTDTVATPRQGEKKIKKLKRGKGRGILMGSPWLYRKEQ